MTKIVAFIDVLGFSTYSEDDFLGAQMLLRNQQSILEQKLDIGVHYPAETYQDPSVSRVAEAHLVDSFLDFLPFSDSTFIVSEEPDKFARQLSNFLIESLQHVGHAYADSDDPRTPESVEIRDLPDGRTFNEKWYPPLWRGGLATGTLQSLRTTGLQNRAPCEIPNLVGSAVAKAVNIEKFASGPRLFCEHALINEFSCEIQPFFNRLTEEVSELLWPAFIYLDGGNPRADVNHFHDLWDPALGLWKSKRGQPAFRHYDEFLKLLIRSCMCWAKLRGSEDRAIQLIQRCLPPEISGILMWEHISSHEY